MSAPSEPPQRLTRWDRPPEPHDWRWVVGGIGRVLITLGLLLFGFVGYQLWGTGIATAQAQRDLAAEFASTLAEAPPAPTAPTAPTSTTAAVVPTTVPDNTSPSPTTSPSATPPATTPETSVAPAAPIDVGAAVARIRIDAIGLDKIVVEGADLESLKKGPGHFRETPMPGGLGNAVIAGHRTTYGAPFGDVDGLAPGDAIRLTTVNGDFVYSVTEVVVVEADQYASVVPTTDTSVARLTLVSCHPKYTARQRIVVRAELVAAESGPVMPYLPPAISEPTTDGGSTLPGEPVGTVPGSETDPQVVDSTIPSAVTGASGVTDDAFASGWFADAGAWPHVVGWSLILLAIARGAYMLARARRRVWLGWVVGAVPFLVALYFFYENVIRLLPAAL